MTVPLPELRVGSPIRHESLSVFPLFSDVNGGIDYRLSDAALADESLVVELQGDPNEVSNRATFEVTKKSTA